MAQKSDSTESAAEIVAAQAARLERLRRLLGYKQKPAADAAGVTRDAWGRMERGTTRIDAVALARFMQHANISGGYVISGTFEGIPADLVRDITRDEAAS